MQRTPEFARDETERWVPGIALTSGILGQNAEGTVSSTSTVTYNYYARQNGAISYNNPPPAPCNALVAKVLTVTRPLGDAKSPPPNAGPTASGSFNTLQGTGANARCNSITGFRARALVLPVGNNDLFLTPLAGTSLEMMTPGLQSVPGRPRLFVHGDVTLAFAFDRNVAKQGTPTGAVIPVGPITPEVEIRGLGSKTSGQVKTLVYGAGGGPAFTFEAFERRLRVRPSVEWMRQEMQVSGVMNKAFQADTGQQQGLDPGLPGGGLTPLLNAVYLQPITLRARDTHVYHGIGPGLEVEMDAARAGPVVLSLFLGGTAYRMLGDLDVHLQANGVVPAQTGPQGQVFTATDQPISADFDFNIHSWAYRGGVGMRFRWLPED